MNDSVLHPLAERVGARFHEGARRARVRLAEDEHVALVQALVRALAAGDYAGFAGHLHPEAELVIVGPAEVPFRGRWQGRQEVADAVQGNFAQVEQEEVEIEHVVAQGDTVVMFGRERGRYRGGPAYDVHWVQRYTFRDGLLLHCWEQVADAEAPPSEQV